MTNVYQTGRRRVLQGAGLGGATLLAGCTEQLGLDDDNGADETQETPEGAEGTEGVGIAPPIDQETFQNISMEVQQEVEEGDLDEEDAPTEMERRQEEYLQGQIDALVDDVESEFDITVEEEVPLLGAVRATGDAEDLIESLELESVEALISTEQLQAPEEPEEPEDQEPEP